MLFNSLSFVYFLPAVIILYYILPFKYRWILLLLASYYFYMCWKVEYILLIVTSTLIDYTAGIMMGRQTKKHKRVLYLMISLITNLGLLFTFKYFNFFSENLNEAFSHFNIMYRVPELHVLLPVGISFYTFQTLSYTIDVYYGKLKPEKHLGYFALYVAFFPQLVAGPIERFSRLTPQLKANHPLLYDNLVNGLRLIIYGLFIKMVIADNLSVYVEEIYANPTGFNALSVMQGVFFYSFQIYSDFYGYSLIAIGSARMMGVQIMDNFNTPYLAKSIGEFWQRWHISLSTWFRDYIYFPMGGNRVQKSRWVFNVMVVFVVSGLWHGASWTFIIWGGMFGILYLSEAAINRFFRIGAVKTPFSAGHILLSMKTFLLVTLLWVFFRSSDFNQAIDVLQTLFMNWSVTDSFIVTPKVWILLVLFIISDMLFYNSRFDKWVSTKPMIVRWTVYALLIFSIIVFAGVENFPFIYFQF